MKCPSDVDAIFSGITGGVLGASLIAALIAPVASPVILPIAAGVFGVASGTAIYIDEHKAHTESIVHKAETGRRPTNERQLVK